MKANTNVSVECYYCRHTFPATTKNHPFKVICPKCHRRNIVNFVLKGWSRGVQPWMA